MKARRRFSFTSATALLVAGSLTATQTGCIVSSTEVVNTDRVYLLGPKTESEPGPATRDVTTKAVDTRGMISFHLDRARECTVTSTPRWQRVHIEGKKSKRVTAGIITGTLLLGAGAGAIAGAVAIAPASGFDSQSAPSADKDAATAATYLLLTGIILAATGGTILPFAIYHGASSGLTVTPQDVQFGSPPPGGVRAPDGYDPKNPETTAMVPRMLQPQYDVMAFGAQPAQMFQGSMAPLYAVPPAPAPKWATVPSGEAKSEPLESLRSARDFDKAMQERAAEDCDAPADPSLLAIPQSSGGGATEQMKACVEKYSPACQSKCGRDTACVLECLKKPCVDNLDKESEPGAADPRDEYTQVITKTEMCERAADSGVGLALVVKDTDGVPKTIDLGKTDKHGDIEKNVLLGLEGTYSGWPDSKQAILPDAQIVLVEDPTTVVGKLDLQKYPGLKYAEHAVSTKKAREALAAAEAARKEKEARDRQAALEAAAKAADDALHADERKAEAARKAQACAAQHQSKCNADCQGNPACVKKCLQKMPACK
ncbi:MAG: hypothetical protein U0441_00100 [Polyangiaceae bacterium]